MGVTIKEISYPKNTEEWYAKGHADVLGDDTYFEVPAVFNADGTCDIASTEAKVTAVMNYLSQRQQPTPN
jgi:hypothetical protein